MLKVFIPLIALFFIVSCAPSNSAVSNVKNNDGQNSNQTVKTSKVTFVELGSDGCTPCQMMRPVMKSVTDNYKDKVEVIFYDVNTSTGGPKAQEYGIRVIPTQVFLNAEGKEIFRHEGYYPYENIKNLLDGWLE
ncbi:MAG: thioredoxin family protein [bacterium]